MVDIGKCRRSSETLYLALGKSIIHDVVDILRKGNALQSAAIESVRRQHVRCHVILNRSFEDYVFKLRGRSKSVLTNLKVACCFGERIDAGRDGERAAQLSTFESSVTDDLKTLIIQTDTLYTRIAESIVENMNVVRRLCTQV